MSGPRRTWKRLVIGLPLGLADQAAIDAAAQLAESLNIELLATFIADATLPAFAAMPGLRELRALEQEWQLIDPARLSRDIEHAIGFARRRFAESLSGRAIKSGFDVLTGAETISSLIRPDDILAVIEPGHPAETIARQFTGFLDAAFEAAGAVLFIPRRITQKTGPIVTDALSSKDPEISIALEITAACKERLIVVDTADASLPVELPAEAERLGIEIDHVAAGAPWVDKSPLASSGRLHPRLRVLTRGPADRDPQRLFSLLQGVPLLVIKPGRELAAVPKPKAEERQESGA